MEPLDPEYISIDFEKTHCPECARVLDPKTKVCYYCEERTREEVLIEM